MAEPKWYKFSFFNPFRNITYYAVIPIDEGGFGRVWSGISSIGVPVAIKIIKKTKDFLKDWDSWINEQNICLMCLKHEHIIQTFDQFCSPKGNLIIVMEKANGSLEDFLSANKPLDSLSVCSIGVQICSALNHIHGLGVVHRDVSLKNILWFHLNVFKLSDFGISKDGISPEELAKTFIGHRNYIPPELLVAGYSTHQSDIYQLGLVLLTLLTGSQPVPDDADIKQTKDIILSGKPRETAEGLVSKHGKLAKIISIMLRRRDKFRYKTAMDVWNELYKEFESRNRTREIMEYILKTNPPKLPPWLMPK